MSTYARYPGKGIQVYNSAINLPTSAPDGSQAVTRDTDTIYIYDQPTLSWLPVATPGAAIAIDGLIGDVTATGPGVVVATIQANVVTNAKLAQMPAMTLKGNNTGSTANAMDLTVAQVKTMLNLAGTNTGDVTIGTANGLSIAGQVLSLQLATTSQNGALSSADWNTFNGKVSGPGSSTTNALALFFDTTGKVLKNSNLTYASDTLSYSGSPRMNIGNGWLLDGGGGPLVSVKWVDRQLINYFTGPASIVLDWQNLTLSNFNNQNTLNWENAQLLDPNAGSIASLDWSNRFTYDNIARLSIDWQSRILYDNLEVQALTYQDRILSDNNGNSTAAWFDDLKARYGSNVSNTLGNLKTKINTTSVQTSTTGSGTDEILYSFLTEERTIRSSVAGDQIHFKMHGNSNGGGTQFIRVTYSGVTLGNDFIVANYFTWSCQGYLYWDANQSVVRYYIEFGNGRDSNRFCGDTGIGSPTDPQHFEIIGNDGTGDNIDCNFVTLDWEAGAQ